MSAEASRIDAAFAAAVRERRIATGIAQQTVANLTGLASQSKVAKIETAGQKVTIGDAYLLVSVLFSGSFPDLGARVPSICQHCLGNPPRGFTCNYCLGLSSGAA